jgi:hypothetical protein
MCEEKDRLLSEYNRAALVYARSVGELHLKRQTLDPSEFKKLRKVADDASIKCKEARLAFEWHVVEHSC